MPQKPIPFMNQQASGSDPLSGASPVAFNVIREPSGAIRRRPGIRRHPEAPEGTVDASGIIGIHRGLDGAIYAVGRAGADRPIYKVTGGAAVNLSVGGAPKGLRGTLRPTFAETEMLLVIAGGSVIEKVELATATPSYLGGSPPTASHVVANAQRILANDLVTDRTKVRYSSPAQGTVTYAGHEQWLVGAGTAGFFTAEARPDPLAAIGEATNELFLFGSETTEVYRSDPGLVFAPVSAQEVGCGAPYSVVKSDQVFLWLDNQRRIVAGNGRSFSSISAPIQLLLDRMARVDDCYAFRVRVGACDALVWVFPADGRALAFQEGAGWAQWGTFRGGNWTATFPALSSSSTDLVGFDDGRIGQWSYETDSDFSDPIRAYIETGFEARETDAVKDCRRVLLALRRGSTANGRGAGSLWYADRPGAWELAGPVDLGNANDSEVVVDFPSLGSYRRRAWKFEFASPSGEVSEDLVLLGATEEYEVTEY